jgi:hypothetical protein
MCAPITDNPKPVYLLAARDVAARVGAQHDTGGGMHVCTIMGGVVSP